MYADCRGKSDSGRLAQCVGDGLHDAVAAESSARDGVYVGGLIAYYLGDDGLVSALEEVRRVAFGYESYRRYLAALYGDGDGRSAAAVAGAGALIGAVLIC